MPGNWSLRNQEDTNSRPYITCPSTFDPQKPIYLTSVSALYCAQTQYTSLALAQLEEGSSGIVELIIHMSMQSGYDMPSLSPAVPAILCVQQD